MVRRCLCPTSAALCIVLGLPVLADASIIAVVGTSNVIVVAADSRITRSYSAEESDTACKVRLDGPLILTASGNAGDLEPGLVGIAPGPIWLSVSGRAELPAARATRIGNLLRDTTVASPLALDGDLVVIGYDESLKPTRSRVHVTLPASATPVPYAVDILTPSARPYVIASVDPAVAPPQGASQVLIRRLNALTEKSVTTLVRELERFIQEYVAKGPHTMGGPIDIAVLRPGQNAEWLQVKDACR